VVGTLSYYKNRSNELENDFFYLLYRLSLDEILSQFDISEISLLEITFPKIFYNKIIYAPMLEREISIEEI